MTIHAGRTVAPILTAASILANTSSLNPTCRWVQRRLISSGLFALEHLDERPAGRVEAGRSAVGGGVVAHREVIPTEPIDTEVVNLSGSHVRQVVGRGRGRRAGGQRVMGSVVRPQVVGHSAGPDLRHT